MHHHTILAILAILVASRSTTPKPSWQTPYRITYNYTTDQPEPAIATNTAKQRLHHLLDNHFTTPWKAELAHVRRRSPRRAQPGSGITDTTLQPHDMLMVVTTSNIWPATQQLLTSLAALTEHVDLLVVDECSSDGTRARLAELGIATWLVNASMGVTHSWNVGYQHFMGGRYTYLVYANNDVLVPPGVLTNLKRALDRGCDLVTPLSTVNGKGHVGLMEGIEAVYNLTVQQANKVIPAGMFAKVQAALDAVYADGALDPVVTRSPDVVFNGFFFAVHRRIAASAYAPNLLFNNQLRTLHQEKDLNARMNAAGQRKCLDLGSFVWHEKGATIPQGPVEQRGAFAAACDVHSAAM